MRSYALAIAAALAAATGSGCSVDSGANPGANACGPTRPCATGTCYMGFCVSEGIDGGSCMPGTTRSCYTGPPGTSEVGECQPGQEECSAGGTWGMCLGETTPQLEGACTLEDEDCDTRVDEFTDEACTDPTRMGICAAGTRDCMGMEEICEQTATATVETCNGM